MKKKNCLKLLYWKIKWFKPNTSLKFMRFIQKITHRRRIKYFLRGCEIKIILNFYYLLQKPKKSVHY